ncbi:hypothetical protein M9H77_27715 [Catharanthus roseus]|uniref:Uncharacterized protein n=1 Tax=Catharanthus roseus TaxID=4058 RepID=A0ACC0AFZ6_CATRO|nr:hypothetical protein M9H77_27715 [Catharanthus roseus]
MYLIRKCMVRPSGHRRDADLGPVTDRTGRVEGRPMLGSARQDSSCSTHIYSHAEYGVSSSDPHVPGPADRVSEGDRGEANERGDNDGNGGDSDGGDDDGGDDDHDDGDDDGDEEQTVYVAPVALASGSDGRPSHGKGKDLTGSLMLVMSKFAGSRNKRPDVLRDVPASTQKRKKVTPSDWEQTEAAEGGPVDTELIPSYCGHVAGRIWRGQDRGLLKCRSRYMALTGWELTDSQAGPLTYGSRFNALELHTVATSRQTSQSHQVIAACYLQYILGSSLFSDKSGNIAWIYLYFPMFAPLFRHFPEECKPTLTPFQTISYKSESKLLDIRLRLDMMTADECIPAHPIEPREARRPPKNRMYILKNTFVEALRLEAPSHLLTETWTSVPAIPASSCTDDYLDWYLSHTHPRIQNPENIPRGYNVPLAAAMPPKALLDMIAWECHRHDIADDELGCRVRDLLRVHYKSL